MFSLLVAVYSLIGTSTHWVKLQDSNKVHAYYVTQYGSLIGGYYQPQKSSSQTKTPYTAQCFAGKPVEFGTEADAKVYVVACPTAK
jgi:hypothetical protein